MAHKKDKVCKDFGVVEKIGTPPKDQVFYESRNKLCKKCMCAAQKKKNEENQKRFKAIKRIDKPFEFHRSQELREMYLP